MINIGCGKTSASARFSKRAISAPSAVCALALAACCLFSGGCAKAPASTETPSGSGNVIIITVKPAEPTPPATAFTEASPVISPEEPVVTAVPIEFSFPETLVSRAAVLINMDDGSVIAARNEWERMFPASVTKVLTVLTALENGVDPEGTVTITEGLINKLVERNAARAGFGVDEKVKAIDLMYAALLPSGADGSVGLAELTAGSESAFAELMNRTAQKVGARDSHFVNASGLHEDDQYSTAYDLALILRYAMNDPVFRSVFSTSIYTTSPTNVHPDGMLMYSTLFKALNAEGIERSYFVGAKTGFTHQAGLCLASIAVFGGTEYLLVTLGAGDGSSLPRYHILDAVAVFDALEKALTSYSGNG